MAAAGCTGRRRFEVACGVLSRRVRAEAAAAAAHARPAERAAAAVSTMLLMPGADVVPDDGVCREEEREAAPAQLAIMYGGRVLVFDDVPAGRAAELLRFAARQDVPRGGMADIPVARKASLQCFMEKRRDRLGAREREPYAVAGLETPSVASWKGKQEGDAGCWLGLGMAGGCAP